MSPTSRRRFLFRALGLLVVLPGCAPGGPSRAEIESRLGEFDRELDCTSSEGLWPAEAATRTDNEYVDRSPHELQYCFVCANYIEPRVPGRCATCRTVKGPVHPLGWCKTWTAQQG